MASSVITYAVIIFILAKIIKRFGFKVRMWVPAFLFLLFNALACFFISFVTTKPLPPSFIVQGNGIPALSLAIGTIILLLGVTTFCKRKSTEIKENKSEKKILAWGIYALGATLVVISYYAVMASVFSPKLFNSSVPVPKFGVYIYVILSRLLMNSDSI